MKRNYIARRFQLGGTGLSLDTEALSKYKDIIDLSIGDTDFTTDEAIISTPHSAMPDWATHTMATPRAILSLSPRFAGPGRRISASPFPATMCL